MSDVDMFQYGKLVTQVEMMEKKLDKLEINMDALLELANKGKGGFWMGMVIASALSAFVGFMSHLILGK